MLSDAIEVLSSFNNMLKRLTEVDFRVSITKKKRYWTTTYENIYSNKLLYKMQRILQIRALENEMRILLLSSSFNKVDFETNHSLQVSLFKLP